MPFIFVSAVQCLVLGMLGRWCWALPWMCTRLSLPTSNWVSVLKLQTGKTPWGLKKAHLLLSKCLILLLGRMHLEGKVHAVDKCLKQPIVWEWELCKLGNIYGRQMKVLSTRGIKEACLELRRKVTGKRISGQGGSWPQGLWAQPVSKCVKMPACCPSLLTIWSWVSSLHVLFKFSL